MKEPVYKIALIGPESSGKTTLCARLASHYKTCWVPEFAREHIASLKRKYTLEDIEYCTRRQIDSEEEAIKKAHRFLFCDSEMIIAKVWCEDVFKVVPEWIEALADNHRYDLFLLTRPDIPFLEDAVRENPHRREFFFDWYKRELEKRKFKYSIIGGDGEVRFQNSIAAIESHFASL